jgi:general secretion pathway protein D
MQRNLIGSWVVIVVFFVLCGCAPRQAEHTFVNLEEINAKIERQGGMSEVLEKETVEAGEKEARPAIKEISPPKGAGNPYLKSFAPTEPKPPKGLEGEGILLNFDNADIYEVIQSIADILEMNYIIDPQVSGVVNIRSGRKIPVSQLFPVFKKILEINGLDMRNEGEYEYIYVAQRHVSEFIRGPEKIGKLKESPRMIMQIVPIMHLSSAEAVKLIEPFLSDHGQVFNMITQNLVIITDFESKLLDCINILAQLDVSPMASLKIALVRVENAPLFDLRDEAEEIMKAMRINQNDFQGVTIMPLERINSLLLVGANQYALDSVEMWVHELDVMPSEGRDNIYIYNVRNSVASELSDLVNSLIAEKAESKTVSKQPTAAPLSSAQTKPGAPPTPAATTTSRPRSTSTGASSSAMQFAGEPILIADDSRNIILIRALPPDYSRIQKLLERLDNMPRQVLIEVMVAEVNLTNDWSMGIEWWAKNQTFHVDGKGFNQDYGHTISQLDVDIHDPLALPGFTYRLLSDTEDIYGLLNLLATDNNINILSSPQVLVLNNETATVNVGNQVPIVTSQFTDIAATGGTTTTANQTVQYKDTGVILNVTPRINYDGIILIDIDQQVSSVNEQITTGVNSPTISTKQVKTKLAVKNGQSILIGGLIEHNTTDNESGIPLLKDVPVFGYLFKFKEKKDDKTELLIVITPYVIENENVLDQYIDQFKEKTQMIRHSIYGPSEQAKTEE